MDDKSAQDDEILAINSIYEGEDIFLFDEEKRSGNFFIKIESPSETDKFCINFSVEKSQINIQYLTPVTLEFELPINYPSVSPPKYKLNCRWLNTENLVKLCTKLDELWDLNSNTSILFTWISFLTDELFEYLNLDIKNLIVLSEDSQCLSNILIDFDHDQREIKFSKSYFPCNVCFNEKLGKECIKFKKCNHVFCNECMKGYFESLISDGNVKKLTCPQDKCESQAIPAQVLNLVGSDMFNRYDSLLLKDALNNMMDIVYCPRVNCQCAVIPEDATLARCPDCHYVFCALCRMGFHGIEPCKISSKQMKEICEKYLNGDEVEKQKLVKQFGEKRIKKAIEESSSMELIERTSKQCPKCKSWMQKLEGCNKMTCSKCQTYFCWLCLKVLNKSDPYSHFNKANSECFEKLFEGVYNINNDEDNDEDDGADNQDDEDSDSDFDIIFAGMIDEEDFEE